MRSRQLRRRHSTRAGYLTSWASPLFPAWLWHALADGTPLCRCAHSREYAARARGLRSDGSRTRSLARIAIDLNVRIGADLTYSGFEDITRASVEDLPCGTLVEVYEAESGALGPGVIAGRDFARRLICIRVDWGKLHCD